MLSRLRNIKPAPFGRAASAFLRLLGVIYLIVFASLGVQIDGLAGSQGILPIQDLLEGARRANKDLGFLDFPSLVWLDSSDPGRPTSFGTSQETSPAGRSSSPRTSLASTGRCGSRRFEAGRRRRGS